MWISNAPVSFSKNCWLSVLRFAVLGVLLTAALAERCLESPDAALEWDLEADFQRVGFVTLKAAPLLCQVIGRTNVSAVPRILSSKSHSAFGMYTFSLSQGNVTSRKAARDTKLSHRKEVGLSRPKSAIGLRRHF